MPAPLQIARETQIDYPDTARMATSAFEGAAQFRSDYLQWLYDRSHSRGVVSIAVLAEGRKVGQLVLLRQVFRAGGALHQAALVIDQCVEPEFRSGPLMIRLFRRMTEACRDEGIRYLFGMPNARATPVVTRFVKAPPYLPLSLQGGLAIGGVAETATLYSGPITGLDPARASALLDLYLAADQATAIAWDGERLLARLGWESEVYGVHATGTVLALSRPYRHRGMQLTLLLGLFARPGSRPTRRETMDAVRLACRHHGHRLFAYAGVNAAFGSLPGQPVPDFLRPSPLTLHMRDETGAPLPQIDRYQLIDFDFA